MIEDVLFLKEYCFVAAVVAINSIICIPCWGRDALDTRDL